MSTEMNWANRLVAVMGRLHKVKPLRTIWTPAGEHEMTLTVVCQERSARTVLDTNMLRMAFQGDEAVQRSMVCVFSGLLKSLL